MRRMGTGMDVSGEKFSLTPETWFAASTANYLTQIGKESKGRKEG